MQKLPLISFVPTNAAVLFLVSIIAIAPARAAQECSVDCSTDVTVDVSTSPCTYAWADAQLYVPSGKTPVLRWKLVGPASSFWGANGVYLSSPPNNPELDLADNLLSGLIYEWRAVHSRPVKFTILMDIYSGAQKCDPKLSVGSYTIDLK